MKKNANERSLPVAQSDSQHPELTTWTGRLTDEGIALAAWLEASGIVLPPVPVPHGNLLPLAALYFRACPDEAARLWEQYAASQRV